MLRNKNLFLTSQGLICPDRIIPVSYGKGGISKRPKEHEPTTPIGEHTIIGMLYRPDRLKKPRDWAMPILINSFWSNDERDPDYNLMVSYSNTYCRKKLRANANIRSYFTHRLELATGDQRKRIGIFYTPMVN